MFNTDDTQPAPPEWSALRTEHQARHGAAIAYVKRQVGPGTEYANEVARAVLSDAGAYFQLAEMPEEFVGAVGAGVSHRLIAEGEALALLGRLEALVRDVLAGVVAVPSLSLYVLYAGGCLRARRSLFVCDHAHGAGAPFTHGAWQPGLPRVFKLRLRLAPGQAPPPGLPASGVVVFLAPAHTDGGQCLLATLARSPQTRDLGAQLPIPKNSWPN